MIADAAILNLPKVSLQAKQLLPEYSGIYYVLDETNTVWYIGQAKNICKRWQGKIHHRIYQLEAQKKKHFTIHYEQISESQLNSIEKQRIEKYHPHLNASPVRTQKVRPTETLLRETIVAIADFAFILGVEPPRQEIESLIALEWFAQKKVMRLNIIHVEFDFAAFQEKFKPESIEETEALIKTIFTSRKAYAQTWESFSPLNSIYRLYVSGNAVEFNFLTLFLQKELEEFKQYSQTTLAQESIRALTLESLAKIQQKINSEKKYALHLKRLKPYILDAVNLLFNEPINREEIKKELVDLSEDYKAGRRGTGSRSKPVDIDQLLISRGIDINKYAAGTVKYFSRSRIGLYLQSFSLDRNPLYYAVSGILDNKEVYAPSSYFELVYLLASAEEKAWLLVEEYLIDFAKPATGLKNGEGCAEKLYVSPRKYISPAKINLKLEDIGYSVWIPFGYCKKFPSFEVAIEEIRKRLENSGIPGLKTAFKNETVQK